MNNAWKNQPAFIMAFQKRWNKMTERYPDVGIIFSLVVILLGMCLFVSIVNPRFLMVRNLTNILVQLTGFICVSVGMTLVITTGGLDISIGSIMGLSAAMMGVSMSIWNMSGPAAIAIGLAVGILAGVINGFFVVMFKVPPLIVTLGTRAAFRGLAYVITGGELLFGFPASFRSVSASRVLGIPFTILVAILVALWGIYFLSRTKTGRHITAIGGNREAARLAGIKVNPTTWSVYIIIGLMAGLAAVIAVSRLDAAQPQIGYDYEIHTIAAVVLGGTLLVGGRGMMLGSILAVIILQVMSNAMVLVGVSFFWQQVVIGLVFVLVVAVRTMRSKESQMIGL